MKESEVHDIYIAVQQSTKIIVGVAAMFDFQLCSPEKTQAYSQSTDKRVKSVYLYFP